jgi:hypothetical protein
MKNWTWISNEGYKRHTSEAEALAYMRTMAVTYGHAESEEDVMITDINDGYGFFTDAEIEELAGEGR